MNFRIIFKTTAAAAAFTMIFAAVMEECQSSKVYTSRIAHPLARLTVAAAGRRQKRNNNWHQFGSYASRTFDNNNKIIAIHALNPSPMQEDDVAFNRRSRVIISSSAGVALAEVEHMLDQLYPPSTLPGRNALSRTDGYWRYVQQGQEPPASLTYGEFDVSALAQLLEEARMEKSTSSSSSWNDCVFTDIGSGTGRMVMAAAALHSWRLCRGIELLPGIHNAAVAIAKERDSHIVLPIQEKRPLGNDTTLTGTTTQPLYYQSAVELCCGSFDDETIYFGDSDFIFCFSTCMNGPTMDRMSRAIQRQCQPGTIIITIDYRLPEGDQPSIDASQPRIQLMREIPTYCQLVGGECTAFLHQLL